MFGRSGWVLAALALAPTSQVFAQEAVAAGGLQTVQQQLEAQDQRIKIMERRLELQAEAANSAAKSAPVVKATEKGFSFQSPDGNNVIKFRGTLHVDGRQYPDSATPETADTWLLRRVRPTIDGTLGGIYDFRFTPDFGGGKTIILDSYVAARLKPWAVITAGKFKVPVGLERIQSANDIRFVERGLPTNLVPNRDIGVQLGGDIAGGTVNYSIGYFNGVKDGSSSDGNPTPDVESNTAGDIAARLFLQPFLVSDNYLLRGLGFGVGATYVDVSGTAAAPELASYKTPGQQTFFRYRTNNGTVPLNNATFADGKRVRLAPQLSYYHGGFGLLGEYTRVSQQVSRAIDATTTRSATLDTSAWQVQLSWFATGEDESFKGFKPASTFEVGKPGWGAFELVARYHEIRFDKAAFAGGADSFSNPVGNPRKASAVGVGVNWYLSQNVKWALNYEVTHFDDGGTTPGSSRPDEKALFTRFAIGF